jgi:hypothetical protein
MPMIRYLCKCGGPLEKVGFDGFDMYFEPCRVCSTISRKMEDLDVNGEVIDCGEFHGWGSDFEEFPTGAVAVTCAIMEKEDGRIKLVYAERVRFVKGDRAKE